MIEYQSIDQGGLLMKHPAHTAYHKNINKSMKGFTLLELLVALILVSIGILGHAKMQMRSMDMAQQASFSQSANSALIDLAQRIRANKTVADEFNNKSNLATGNPLASSHNCITSSSCTKAQFVSYELDEWFNNLTLPAPRFDISKNGNLFALTLTWDAAGTGNANCSASTSQCGELNLWLR